jgi:hypothetical protein
MEQTIPFSKTAAYRKEYAAKNKDKRKEWRKEYYQEHKAEVLIKQKQYYQRVKEMIKDNEERGRLMDKMCAGIKLSEAEEKRRIELIAKAESYFPQRKINEEISKRQIQAYLEAEAEAMARGISSYDFAKSYYARL